MVPQFRPALKIARLDVDPARQHVELEARPNGLIAAVLHLIGLGGTSRLTVDPSGVWLQENSLTGASRTYCALPNVAASLFLSAKPNGLLIMGAVFACMGFPMAISDDQPVPGVVMMVLGGILCVAYLMSQHRVSIGVVTNATTLESLKVVASGSDRKRLETAAGIIEGLLGGHSSSGHGHLDEGDAEEAEDEAWDPPPAPRDVPPPLPASAGRAGVAAAGTFVVRCMQCGANLKLKDSLRGKTVACPGCKQTMNVPFA